MDRKLQATSNIHSRYSLLFHLPSTSTAVALLLSTTLPIAILVGVIGLGSLAETLLLLPIYLLTLLLSVGVDVVALRRYPLATPRRLLTVSTVANGGWLAAVLLGLASSLLLKRDLGGVLPLAPGMLLAASIRLLVFTCAFTSRFTLTIPASLSQPLMLGGALLHRLPLSLDHTYLIGILIFLLTLLYLLLLNRRTLSLLKSRPLEILRAFLLAWAEGEPGMLEEVVERNSSEADVETLILSFEEGGCRPALVVSDAHPGPFHPIGSYNLPYNIAAHLQRLGYTSMVLHGVSDHEMDLPSKREVERFLSSIEASSTVSTADTCTHPVKVSYRRATVTGTAFGGIALLTLTLSPYGADDLPLTVKEGITRRALELGYTHLLLADAHNSEGGSATEEDYTHLVQAAGRVLEEIQGSRQERFQVGFSHSSEVASSLGGDVGPGGMGLLLLEVGGVRYGLVVVDANNAVSEFREELLKRCGGGGLPILELCTSDSHVTAGRILEVKGYLSLGEVTGVQEVVDTLSAMKVKAEGRLTPARVVLRRAKLRVKTVGVDLLNETSRGLDHLLSFAKRAGLTLASLILILLLASAAL